MIKPVSVGLRILAILCCAIISVVGAPVEAIGQICSIIASEMLAPLVNQMEKLRQQLEQA